MGARDNVGSEPTQNAMAVRQGFQAVLEALHAGDYDAFQASSRRFGKEELSQLKDGQGRSVLHHAAQAGHQRIVAHLIEVVGMDVNEQDKAGETPLALAAATARVDSVRFLLSSGAKPNLRREPDGTAPLHRAANADSTEVIGMLLVAGASVDISSRTGTPLCWASSAGLHNNVDALLSAGASPKPEGRAGEPLLLAAACGSETSVASLLKAGACPKQPGRGASTPLHAVAAVELDEGVAERIAKLLLDAGADADAADDGGLCALAMAAVRGQRPLVSLLLSATKPGAPGLEGVDGGWSVDGVLLAGERLREKLESATAEVSQRGDAGGAAAAAAATVPEPEQPDAEAAAAAKRQSDEAFVRGNSAAAVEGYTRSLRHATRNAAVWANRAMAYLKLNRPEEALKDAVMARTIDPAYVKAWYREGSAYAALAPPQWEEAALAFFHASEMDPGNADVKAAFQHAITEGRKEHATR